MNRAPRPTITIGPVGSRQHLGVYYPHSGYGLSAMYSYPGDWRVELSDPVGPKKLLTGLRAKAIVASYIHKITGGAR